MAFTNSYVVGLEVFEIPGLSINSRSAVSKPEAFGSLHDVTVAQRGTLRSSVQIWQLAPLGRRHPSRCRWPEYHVHRDSALQSIQSTVVQTVQVCETGRPWSHSQCGFRQLRARLLRARGWCRGSPP